MHRYIGVTVVYSQGKVQDSLVQRLKLTPAKIEQLAAGIRSIAKQVGCTGRSTRHRCMDAVLTAVAP